jgi:peptidoglycan/xylan/chitin deacetylase (PgdA/CDA1 family)
VSSRDVFKGAAAFLLLPLSLAPLYFAVPRIRGETEHVDAERRPLSVPTVHSTPAELQRWRTLPAFRGAVPVLCYHGINDHGDHYSVSQKQFTQQMDMLRRAGFESISIAQYVRFLHGDDSDMPDRPILITFDDGRLDSYQGADKVLAEFGFRATMFVIVGQVDDRSQFYLHWNELRLMAQSSRWDIQEHAGVGHVNVRYDAAGHIGPAYAYERYLGGGQVESFSEFRHRVRDDILWAKQTLSQQIPGYSPWSFALPFGDFGQGGTNDPRIPKFMNRFLGEQFPAVFLTWPPRYSTLKSPTSKLGRIEVHSDMSTNELYNALEVRMPASAKKAGRVAAATSP